jgi:hypothetical protein
LRRLATVAYQGFPGKVQWLRYEGSERKP